MLEAVNLGVGRQGAMLLENGSMQVLPGSITALIGPSGSGKTSLLSCLAGVLRPEKGEVRLDGAEIGSVPGLHPKVSMVFQELFLWPHLTLRENILLPLNGAYTEAVEAYCSEFGLETCIDRYPEQVSVGQRQRAALVRALVLNPRYLLLDEITSALDVEQIAVVAACLGRLRAAGVGIVLVTHLVGLASRLADQVLFLDKGALVPLGSGLEIQKTAHTRAAQFLSLVEV